MQVRSLVLVASNDNDDLFALSFPAADLAFIRGIKRYICDENAQTGVLLRSRSERRFFQEILDAENYILLRYFTRNAPEQLLKALKRKMLDRYLAPRKRRRQKKS